jgi:putative membrane-bound dehydrogenase-like protein
MKTPLLSCLLLTFLFACERTENNGFNIDQVAGNEEVARYLDSFQGRGALSDSTLPTPAEEALKNFVLPGDLEIDLVLSEPMVNQPLELTFDHRGRLWVVQYNQYPYPKGLKVTGIDNHLRIAFDKTPAPPPEGIEGADKIVFYEDTDQDGIYDKSTDAITGLNIATGLAFGRKKIWVLNPPYLLAYPDEALDGLPDGPPEVHLRGFGLEDTHAVANSLRWGPDGWLYGATGSTVTSDISSAVTKNLQFEGQGIWRYHPETEIFELFAEGGGNTFHVEIDAKGRIYSGHNGANTRGQYYKQGGYYVKNWGKHGPLTNPHAYGYLRNMAMEGDALRFTHGWIKYEANLLPDSYFGRLIAINPLLNYLQLSEIVPNGSTFRTIDVQKVLHTEDHWFRPVDIKVGPDGAVYIADWYDSRLSHIDPVDNWHKTSGRIYRIRSKQYEPVPHFDLSGYSDTQLIELLSHPNKWYRQQAIRQFGDRKHQAVIQPLQKILVDETGQLALEALWAINISGYFDHHVAEAGLKHIDPYVRMWTVRLLGDKRSVAPETYQILYQTTVDEGHPEVLGQLASTAKRLPVYQALPLLKELIKKSDLVDDPDNPLLIWWALESKVSQYGEQVIGLFENPEVWDYPLVEQVLMERLTQKLIMENTESGTEQIVKLLSMVPDQEKINPVMEGIQEGLRGKGLSSLPEELAEAILPYWGSYSQAPLSLQIQQNDEMAIASALSIIADEQAVVAERLAYIKLMGALQIDQSVPVLLKVMENQNARASVRQSSLQALANFQNQEIGARTAAAYPDKLRADPALRLAALNLLATRDLWAVALISSIEDDKKVAPQDLPLQIVRQLQLLDNDQLNRSLERIWPEIASASSREKQQTMNRILKVVGSGPVDYVSGKAQYSQLCGSCHILFDEGGATGPELTGYDRRNLNYLAINIVDPNLEIREGFVNYKITTSDQRTLTGVIAHRSSEVVILRLYSGNEVTLPMDQILQMEAQPISIMPERLVDHLNDQELRNLFGYIMKKYDEIN